MRLLEYTGPEVIKLLSCLVEIVLGEILNRIRNIKQNLFLTPN